MESDVKKELEQLHEDLVDIKLLLADHFGLLKRRERDPATGERILVRTPLQEILEQLLNKIDNLHEIRNKKVVFVRANGGWSNMDYQITMNLEKE